MSETLFIFDTNILLSLVHGDALAKEIDQRLGLRACKTRPLISIVSHGELGVLAKRN